MSLFIYYLFTYLLGTVYLSNKRHKIIWKNSESYIFQFCKTR